jgi:diadenosine tetraphosphate (Ap4A) HIT family hydrolase
MRHVASYFQLRPDEQGAIWTLVFELQQRIQHEHAPAGYNVGFNVGAAGGQTVWHAHVHVIPRYPGDVDDPRGGIRWVVGSRAAYWKPTP